MVNVLVVYQSFDGQTAKVAQRLSSGLRARGVAVDVYQPAKAPEPTGYDVVVAAGAIRFGRHPRRLVRWLRGRQAALARVPVVVVQVSMTAATDDAEHRRIAAGFTDGLVRRTGVQPVWVEDVAGALRYSRYDWVTKRVMRSIARREGNATDTSRDHEYTDWDAVDQLVDRIVTLVPAPTPAEPSP